MGSAASRPHTNMLAVHQDRPVNAAFLPPSTSSLHLHGNGKFQKDGNCNYFTAHESDENQNRNRSRAMVRPRALTLSGRDQLLPSGLCGPGPASPLSRLACWSPLEPLPEVEGLEEGCGRVPPEGAEREAVMEEGAEEKQLNEKEVEEEEGDEDEWDESDSEFNFSYCSGSSLELEEKEEEEGRACDGRSQVEKEGRSPEAGVASDWESEPWLDGVWSASEREQFKAQEMERHQAQLSLYRRLALIRWVRALQGRVQEQQGRLQASFDLILTHRKELLRLGAGLGVATPTAATPV